MRDEELKRGILFELSRCLTRVNAKKYNLGSVDERCDLLLAVVREIKVTEGSIICHLKKSKKFKRKLFLVNT